ncbi:hypothetical protein RhiirA1_41867 [Rhizophagus irregularis]|uniref:Uncharacterized protein n=2 Tax=Rhizophagus irregularis TaxID=588596 RepID=U9TVE4_RHIID|nr:hypothetical protein GLOIN_2v300187 [Rhizophagus irregularis DAOM 181602=DAOM 197198]PKC59329.1 hypothetical protein RhiirA1_41867 [Rhizophagus irregularis]POG67358.1 hypothetical protein GLOIN_2v300187 [Rhizophagus irregularis DAOM 181602=DAOM 197198]GBC25255.1 hypothetical protein GLOIN_2v300187 [Rhizophagus irregularis DAOM 181602=DAOM 197198]|eukprot:XP_025174224.1 hypothetical protein GLOIN_2v300187 [Rhizophagus irregularis DAOM 181602=DAOM 197198]
MDNEKIYSRIILSQKKEIIIIIKSCFKKKNYCFINFKKKKKDLEFVIKIYTLCFFLPHEKKNTNQLQD